MTALIGPGTFVAVVGPSGAGKDSIIDWARSRAAERADQPVFPRRAITRPAGPGEEHLPVDEAGFLAAEAHGDFAAAWRAHGLAYGIPVTVDDAVRAGRTVVVNVSRSVLPALSTRYERLRVVQVTVADDVRRARLAARGREVGDAAETRIARPDPAPGFPVDLSIVNDGPLEQAGLLFVAFLASLR